jgi:cytochrome c-type biogenesis protein CcmE
MRAVCALEDMKFAVAGSVLVLAVGYLILTGMQNTTVYYLTVGELQSRGAGALGRPVRVAGNVTPGSVEKLNGGLALRFTVEDESGSFPVVYKGGPVPDIFGEQVQVVVEGKVQPDGTFAADTLLAKCPSKFES